MSGRTLTVTRARKLVYRSLILENIIILITGVITEAPSALTVTMVTATSITITWTQSSDIESNISLTCTASRGASMTYTYNWLRYDGDIVDETSPTISFPLREADVGRYNCRGSDDFLTNTSDGVVINIEGE